MKSMMKTMRNLTNHGFGKRHNHRSRDYLSDSDSESSSSTPKQERRRSSTMSSNKRKGRRSLKQEDSFDDWSSSSSIDNHRRHNSSNKFKNHGKHKRRHSTSGNQSMEPLTREELFEMPARKLRKMCHELRLDARMAVEKADLVSLLHEYYRQGMNNNLNTANTMHQRLPMNIPIANRSGIGAGLGGVGQHNNNMMLYDETEQMIEIIQEIIPFYGQGDTSADSIVRDTLERLQGYSLEARDSMGNTILMQCCQYSNSLTLVPLLLAKGSDPNAQNRDGVTCLHFACYTETFSPETVKLLIDHRANAEVCETSFGCTPLHWAASAGDTNVCKMLCSAGARSTTIDKNGCDPIAYAKQSQKKNCVQFLMSVAAKPTGAQKILQSPTNNSCEKDNDFNFDDWVKMIDRPSGYTYYHNHKSGQSLWDDEFMKLKNQSNDNAIGLNHQDMNVAHQDTEKKKRPPPPSPAIIPSQSKVDDDILGDIDVVMDVTEGNIVDSSSDVSDTDSKASSCKETKDPISPTKRREKGKYRDGCDIKPSHLTDLLSDTSSTSSTKKPKVKLKEVNKVKSNKLTIQIPKRQPSLSAMSPVIQASQKQPLDKETKFEERLASLQIKMEEQFIDQLKKMESKIVESQKGKENEANNRSIDEITSKLIALQSELGSKDLEILSLQREIMALEGKLASSIPSSELVDKKDAMIGNSNVNAESWVTSEEFQQMTYNLDMKTKQLIELEKQHSELSAKLGTTERQLSIIEEKLVRDEKQILVMESALNDEKNAKAEAISLLEKARKGKEVDTEITHTLEEDKRRAEEVSIRLKRDLDELEQKSNSDTVALSRRLEEQERKHLDESVRVKRLTEEYKNSQKVHKEEIQKLTREHASEVKSLQDHLSKSHQSTVEELQRKFQEEKLAKMEKEIERNEAIQSYENALKRTQDAEMRLKKVTDVVKEAKVLVGVNERLHRSLHNETEKRKTLHNKLEDLKGRIRVYVRIRPLSGTELSRNCDEALSKEDKRTCIMSQEDERKGVKSWEFDQVFCGSSHNGNSQEDIFKDTRLLVTSAIDGFNVCIFAYGQTGSGKTFTMFGPGGEIPMLDNGHMDDQAGLAPRVAMELFHLLEEREASCDISVNVNMFELYNDNIRDLLALPDSDHAQLRIKLAEHNASGLVDVDGAVTESVYSAAELLDLFQRGSKQRTTASTKMNADSSRSHLITSMVTNLVNKRSGRVINGKLTLVDLAGSERLSKSGATGHQMKEAQSINKSLSALGDVINALTSGSKHIPYRNHPLTMLMSDSLGGNAKTLMFVCCSPADYNRSETANSLDFAKRCKDVKNNINGSAADSAQIKTLKAELSRMKRANGGSFRKKPVMSRRPGALG